MTEITADAAARHARVGVAGIAASIYRLLFPVPIVCFVGAMVTDIAYASSEFLMWLHFSEWLIAAGLLVGALALLALLVEFVADRVLRRRRLGWTHLLVLCVALVVELINALVHTSDGWTAVMPGGLTLSIAGAVFGIAAVVTLFRTLPGRWARQAEPRR